jgi:hypothetical protein
MEWMVNATPQPLYSHKTALVHIVQVAGWDPGPVWTDVKNRKYRGSTVFRTLNHPAIYIIFIVLLKLVSNKTSIMRDKLV